MMTKIKKCYLLLFILAILIPLVLHFKKNFHIVIPKKIYRSAQLNKTQLKNLIHDKKIKSIINLRGDWPSNAWYRDEVQLSQQHQLHLYNLKLKTHGIPRFQRLQCLATILATAPKPLLVHCRQGADRTGLASSVALILNNEKDMSRIQAQSSWRYFAVSSDSVGKTMLIRYNAWLHKHKRPTSRQAFLSWLAQSKTAVPQTVQNPLTPISPFCRHVMRLTDFSAHQQKSPATPLSND